MIGAPHSGSGKTLLTLGIMAALGRRGLKVQPFKCGPDFIDPTLHEMVVGLPSRNLDLFMMGGSVCREVFAKHCCDCDVAVVEGVMGLFDGSEASTAALARLLNIPVVLVVDARSAAESIAALIKGFEVFDPELQLSGVILNQVGSKRHVQLISDSMATNCQSRLLGAFPRESGFCMPERHLGLHMGDEHPLTEDQRAKLADAVEKYIDIQALLDVTRLPRGLWKSAENNTAPQVRLRLAVARDAAFSFYYQDNLDIFADLGFDLCFFSPLVDEHLPEGTAAVYIGGGYPELHARQLSHNSGMLDCLRNWVLTGGPLYCECGGLMYMARDFSDQTGTVFPMADVFPLRMEMKKRFSSLGYRRVTLAADCFLGCRGDILFGHEFHYSAITEGEEDIEQLYVLEDGRREGYRSGNAIGSYIHLHFGRSLGNIRHFYQSILAHQQKGERS